MMNRALLFAMVATSAGCQADLAIEAVSAPPSACLGEDLAPTSSVTIVNRGSEDITDTIHVAWYLSSDDVLDAGDTLLVGGRDQVEGLGAGEEVAVELHALELPEDTAPGSHYLLVVVDDTNAVDESDEANNVVALPLSVVSCAPECTGSSPTQPDERVEAIAIGPAGEVYVAGTRASVNEFARDGVDGFLRRMDPSATSVVWETVIDHCYWDSIFAVGVSANGDPVVSGATRVGPFAETDTDIVVRKYSPDGDLRWQVSPRTAGYDDLATALAIDPTNDDIVLTGSSLASGDSFSTLVNRVSSNGLVRFSYDIDPIPSSLGRAVDVGPGGEIIVAGDSSGGDAYVARLTPAGLIEWVQVLDDPVADWRVKGVVRTPTSIDVLAELFTTGPVRVPVLNRFSLTGASVWENRFTLEGSPQFSPPSALQAVGDVLFVAGRVPQPRGSGIERPWLAHIDGAGVVQSIRILEPEIAEVTGLAIDPSETTAYLAAQVSGTAGTGRTTSVVRVPLWGTAGAMP